MMGEKSYHGQKTFQVISGCFVEDVVGRPEENVRQLEAYTECSELHTGHELHRLYSKYRSLEAGINIYRMGIVPEEAMVPNSFTRSMMLH